MMNCQHLDLLKDTWPLPLPV